MESQLHRPVQEDAQQNVGLHSGEGGQPGEKKSMLQKVKDKAKKLKGTVKKQGRGQGPEHENRYDDENLEEDEDDGEIANDREIHGAPMNDSTVNNTSSEKLTDTRGDRIDPMLKGEAKARPNIPVQVGDEQEMQPGNKHFPSPISVESEEAKDEGPDVKLGPSMGLEEDPHSTKTGPQETHVPPSNYESKVPDPTGAGGKEAGVEPLIRSFDNLDVGDKSETKPDSEQQRTCTGRGQDQFSPQPYPTQEDQQLNPESKLDAVESDPKSLDSNETEGMPRDSDTITGKVSSAITGSAISAKNAVASKLGYGGGSGQEGTSPPNNETESQEGMRSPDNKTESESAPPGYTRKIAETVNPVYEKVAGAGTAVLSKFQGGSSGQEGNTSDKPESGSTPPQPGYTQKIVETLNPVYEKVAGAGTAVRSKFQGGGEAENQGGDLQQPPKGQTNP